MSLFELYYIIRVVAGALFHSRIAAPRNIHPLLANFNLTENCNAKCVTCDYWRGDKDDGISTERAKELIAECAAAGVRNLRFTGGEPLVRRDLFDVLKSVHPHQFTKIVLATNGLLIGRYADEINTSPITSITVSLDAMEERNDTIRGIDGYYQKTLENLDRVNKPIKIVSTFTKELTPDLQGLIDLCKAKGYRYDINLLDTNLYFFSSPEIKAEAARLNPSQQEALQMLDLLEQSDYLTGCVLASARHFIRRGKFDFRHCMQGYVEVNIDSTGGVRSGCNVFNPIGDINRNSLIDIISSTAYRDSVGHMFDFDCPGCTCGYGISSVLNRPFTAAFSYLSRRLT
jgi:MoaA/NifB/PqqE/SkfB family radical SAM enzyme